MQQASQEAPHSALNGGDLMTSRAYTKDKPRPQNLTMIATETSFCGSYQLSSSLPSKNSGFPIFHLLRLIQPQVWATAWDIFGCTKPLVCFSKTVTRLLAFAIVFFCSFCHCFDGISSVTPKDAKAQPSSIYSIYSIIDSKSLDTAPLSTEKETIAPQIEICCLDIWQP